MVRLLLRLLGIKDFEVCKSCETLKAQLEFSNNEKRELLETLLNLTKPEVKVQSAEVKVLNPLTTRTSFRQQRGILENMHKRKDEVMKTSPFIAKPDDSLPKEPATNVTQQSITELENKLGLADENVS